MNRDPKLIDATADFYLDSKDEVWQHMMVPDSLRAAVEARSAQRNAALGIAMHAPGAEIHRRADAAVRRRYAGVEISTETTPRGVVAVSGIAAAIGIGMSALLFIVGM